MFERVIGNARNDARISELVHLYLVFEVAAVNKIERVDVAAILRGVVRADGKERIALVPARAALGKIALNTPFERRSLHELAFVVV